MNDSEQISSPPQEFWGRDHSKEVNYSSPPPNVYGGEDPKDESKQMSSLKCISVVIYRTFEIFKSFSSCFSNPCLNLAGLRMGMGWDEEGEEVWVQGRT